MIDKQILYYSGVLIPVIYIFLYVVGGALRPGYNQIRNSVSELLSPGAPNKVFLMIIQVIYALLYVIFGLGIWQYYMDTGSDFVIGKTGAWMIVALGLTTFATVIFHTFKSVYWIVVQAGRPVPRF
jgi:hypothetical protein